MALPTCGSGKKILRNRDTDIGNQKSAGTQQTGKSGGYRWSPNNICSTEVSWSYSEAESQMSWGRGTQETGTHEGPLAVVQARSDRDLNWNSGEEETTDGEERNGGQFQ